MVFKEYFIFVFLLFNNAAGDPTYEAVLMGMTSCPDFENKYILCDGVVMELAENGKGMRMGGYLKIEKELEGDFEFTLSVEKETENGNEPVMSAVMSLDAALKDENAPWSTMCKEMNITSCPVLPGEYNINDVTINLDFAESVMNRDNCGDYSVQMVLMCSPTEKCGCMNMGLSIEERNGDDE